MQYPKVVIIGETFRSNGGGGITMMNLFKEWPTEKLAVITELTHESSREYHCNKYYQIGYLEKRIPFPLSVFKRKIISGDFQIHSSCQPEVTLLRSPKGIKVILKSIYYKTIHLLGFYHFTYRMTLSNRLLNWVNDYAPDIIYHQPFNYSDMQLAYILKCTIQRPMVVHVMDDIVSFANKPNLLYFFWQNKIRELFRTLIDSASSCLSISDSMSEEYYKRYGKEFQAFRNPVEVEKWLPYIKKKWAVGKPVRLIYTGRLATPNMKSLLKICRAINNLRQKMHDIIIDIYSLDENKSFYRKIKSLDGINIMNPVSYSEMPELMNKYDIAVLPIDFDRRGIKFAKYSISTKTSEYLISMTPVFLLAPEGTALSNYACKTESMFVLNDQDIMRIESALIELCGSISLREQLAERAFSAAIIDSDGAKVRKSFSSAIITATSAPAANSE